MGNNRLSEILERFPFIWVFIGFLAYVGYQYYEFTTAPDSKLQVAHSQIEAKERERVDYETKLKAAKEFYRTFEVKRVQLRDYTLQLQSLKSTLSDRVDVPLFMKSLVQEAEKVGLVVSALKPSGQVKRDYYMEQSFDLSFSGVYVQLLVFLDHLANLDKIVRVENFDIRRKGSATAPYVELTGTVQVLTYSYLGTKADEVAQSIEKPAGSPTPSTPATVIPSQGIQGAPAQPKGHS